MQLMQPSEGSTLTSIMGIDHIHTWQCFEIDLVVMRFEFISSVCAVSLIWRFNLISPIKAFVHPVINPAKTLKMCLPTLREENILKGGGGGHTWKERVEEIGDSKQFYAAQNRRSINEYLLPFHIQFASAADIDESKFLGSPNTNCVPLKLVYTNSTYPKLLQLHRFLISVLSVRSILIDPKLTVHT